MPGNEAMVKAMEAMLGLGESPPGSNNNYVTAWYPMPGQPWCDMGISYAAAHSGNGAVVGKFAYTPAHAQWFKNKGQWHQDIAGIRRGDIVFFSWSFRTTISSIEHVGLVTGVSGGNVLTIEGNISNKCMRKVRGADTIVGYGRPAYVGASPAPKPVPKPQPKPQPNTGFEPYPAPGPSWFSPGRKHSIIARMHDRLVAEGCNHYRTQANKDVWGQGDRDSYSAWQKKLGNRGVDANGIPGPASWAKLKVPKAS
jgi:hypothetical protein